MYKSINNSKINKLNLILFALFLWSLFFTGCASKTSSLLLAAESGDVAKIDALFAKGADVNAKTYDGFTALFVASQGGHSEIVKLLQTAGAKE